MTIESKIDKRKTPAIAPTPAPAPEREENDTPPGRGRVLQGSKAISDYLDISINTLMKRIYQEDLPASQIGGVWTSDTALIDRWMIARIERDTEQRRLERYDIDLPRARKW